MKTFTIIVYTDPSHGCSYQYKDNVYLEEDCDLPLLVQTLFALDVRVKFVEKSTNKQSRIRSYESYAT